MTKSWPSASTSSESPGALATQGKLYPFAVSMAFCVSRTTIKTSFAQNMTKEGAPAPQSESDEEISFKFFLIYVHESSNKTRIVRCLAVFQRRWERRDVGKVLDGRDREGMEAWYTSSDCSSWR